MRSSFFTLSLMGMLLISGCGRESNTDIKEMKIVQRYTQTVTEDFSQKEKAWESHEGTWMWDNGTLVQTATDDSFPLILREKEQFGTLDISVRFKPLSGRIDASGGVVFRALDEANYYIVRANALEDNFRLYTFTEGSRSQIASATVTKPALGKWHTIRVIVQGDHIQAYLDSILYIDHHDSSFVKGYVGLWTKADSVTAFDDLKVRGE